MNSLDIRSESKQITSEIQEINNWAFQWKKNINYDPPKQPQEVMFSRRHSETSHSMLICNSNPVQDSSLQKHLGIILESKLN